MRDNAASSETTASLRRHRALSSAIRARIVAELTDNPGADTAALAERLGLHVNTVRTHLNVLEDAELVVAQVEQRDRPGRPRRLYRVAAAMEDRSEPSEQGYRFLSSVLASYLSATSPDAAEAAEHAGQAWGSFVIDKPQPFAQIDASEGLNRLIALLESFGFDPKLEAGNTPQPRVVLRRCPFLDVARENPDVVCSVHLGLMRGALDELGLDIEAVDLVPWAEPAGCVSHLRVGSPAD